MRPSDGCHGAVDESRADGIQTVREKPAAFEKMRIRCNQRLLSRVRDASSISGCIRSAKDCSTFVVHHAARVV